MRCARKSRRPITAATSIASCRRFTPAFRVYPAPARPVGNGTSGVGLDADAEIAETVFAPDLRRSYLVRGWLYRWLESLPAYLAWQAERETHWQIAAAEIRKEAKTCDGDVCLTLTGRIDRLDRGHDGYAITDYKTGALPTREDVLNGEQVQLTHYALLCDDLPSQAQFLGLLRDGVTDKVRLEGPELVAITARVRERLLHLYRGMKHGTKTHRLGRP